MLYKNKMKQNAEWLKIKWRRIKFIQNGKEKLKVWF
jgi:hypothetical protein